MSESDSGSKHAAGLSRLGAAKGGKARALALSPDERREIARLAAEKRWGVTEKTLPRATHAGPLNVGDISFDCAVLSDNRRVISETKFMEAMGMYRSGALSTRRKDAGEEGSAPIPLFLAHKNLKPFVDKHLVGVHFEPLKYRTQEGSIAHGILAAYLPKVCEVWIDADRAGVLGPRQKIVAAKADLLLRGFAHVGIIALVDEATGFQADRARDDLQRILEAYIAEELRPWVKRFPDEFFRQIYRLHNWEFRPGTLRGPRYVGKLINRLVWDQLPPGVKEDIDRKNPPNEKWQRKYRKHQFLTDDIGEPHLNKQIIEVTAIMRVADDKEMFFRLFEKAFPKRGQQLRFELAAAQAEDDKAGEV